MKTRAKKDYTKSVVVRKSLIAGRGIFTTEKIPKNVRIFRTGNIWNTFIFTNHSCKPNSKLTRARNQCNDVLVSVRAIKAGAELTMDYRKTRWAHYFDTLLENNKGKCLCLSCAKKKHKKTKKR